MNLEAQPVIEPVGCRCSCHTGEMGALCEQCCEGNVAAERERCAKVAEQVGMELREAEAIAPQSFRDTPEMIARRIRSGE